MKVRTYWLFHQCFPVFDVLLKVCKNDRKRLLFAPEDTRSDGVNRAETSVVICPIAKRSQKATYSRKKIGQNLIRNE
jgi:hypothetical protein